MFQTTVNNHPILTLNVSIISLQILIEQEVFKGEINVRFSWISNFYILFLTEKINNFAYIYSVHFIFNYKMPISKFKLKWKFGIWYSRSYKLEGKKTDSTLNHIGKITSGQSHRMLLLGSYYLMIINSNCIVIIYLKNKL